MEKTKERMITHLQENLSVIRRVAGWSTEELGNRIGVTKQTISNLENNKTKMTLTQYIAIRSVLDYEIETNPDNIALAQVIEILLNRDENLSEEEEKKIKKAMEVIAAAAAGGASKAALASTTGALLATVGITLGGPIVTGVIVAGSALWMPKLIEKITKKKK